MSTFGEKVKAIREERGMTQEQFADLLGTSKQVISRYETNQRTPKITIVQEYARRLGVGLSYLLDNSFEPESLVEYSQDMGGENQTGDRGFSQRLQMALDRKGMKAAELARLTGTPESVISQYKKGYYVPNQRRLEQFSKVLGVSIPYLMGNENEPATAIPPGFEPMPKTVRVPIVGSIACGEPILAEENLEGYCNILENWKADFCLICKGNSMEPKIKDGDVVAIKKQSTVENGEIAAVRIDNEATLKRVYYDGDKLLLQPENASQMPIVLVGEEINTCAIEGKAVGLCRGFERIV